MVVTEGTNKQRSNDNTSSNSITSHHKLNCRELELPPVAMPAPNTQEEEPIHLLDARTHADCGRAGTLIGKGSMSSLRNRTKPGKSHALAAGTA